jgi:hypothetical protein
MEGVEGDGTRIINDREKCYMEFNVNSMAKLFYETEERAGYSKKMDKTNLQMFVNDVSCFNSLLHFSHDNVCSVEWTDKVGGPAGQDSALLRPQVHTCSSGC